MPDLWLPYQQNSSATNLSYTAEDSQLSWLESLVMNQDTICK